MKRWDADDADERQDQEDRTETSLVFSDPFFILPLIRVIRVPSLLLS
jgi:hypothetical protein